MRGLLGVNTNMGRLINASCSTDYVMVQFRGRRIGVDQELLLVALGCGRLPWILAIAASNPFEVFGTMEWKGLASLTTCDAGNRTSNLPVYFYETG